MIRDVADTKMRAWKKQMASLPRHRQLEAERMQVFADTDHGAFQVTHCMILCFSTYTQYIISNFFSCRTHGSRWRSRRRKPPAMQYSAGVKIFINFIISLIFINFIIWISYHLIINLVSIVGSMQLRTQGCNFQTSANRSLSWFWWLLILKMMIMEVII